MTVTHLSHLAGTGVSDDSLDLELSIPSPDAVKTAFARFPSGVASLCAVVDGEPVGLVASSFSVGVSFEPPLVLFSVQNSSRTWPVLRTAARIGVSVLGSGHALVCRQLASRHRDRFAGLDTHRSETDALFIRESPLWLECRIMSEIPAGDHQIVVLEVTALRVESEAEPLIYHVSRFRRLAG